MSKQKATESAMEYFGRNAVYFRQSHEYFIEFNGVRMIDLDTADLFKQFEREWNEVYEAV